MKPKIKKSSWILIAALVLLIVGVYFTAFSAGIPGHLKIYFLVGSNSTRILEASPEFQFPLAGIQPYTQNLTSGARTLTVTAYSEGKLVLNQTYSGIGQGYDVRRTSSLRPSPASNSTVAVTLKLLDKGMLIAEDQTTITPWGRDSISLISGILAILIGAVLIASNLRFRWKDWRINPKNTGWFLVIVLFAIVLGDYTILVVLLNTTYVDAIGITGWMVGIISLVLYIKDRFDSQPVFLQIHYEPVPGNPGKYLIEANISNEGGMGVRSCTVSVTGEGIESTLLSRVVVEGPRGAVRAEPPNDQVQVFPLYSKRPVWTRGYIIARENTLVTVALMVRDTELEKVSFHISSQNPS